MVYGRDKIIAFNRNYRGSADETQVEPDEYNDMVSGEGVHPDVTNHP
jgi:glutamate-1-semialdehyde aminotransferase